MPDSMQFTKADRALFAVYQTVHSQADIEMWFAWKDRLSDTQWSDDCYFLQRDGEKIGGAIISDGLVIYAFLISPFCDRYTFWKSVLVQAKAVTTGNEVVLRGMLADDVHVLQNHGARLWRARQIMCRPTDMMPYEVPDGYRFETPQEDDISEIARMLHQSYTGGISYEMFGEDSEEQVMEAIANSYARYAGTDTMDQFIVARHEPDGAIVGACIAGINPEMPNGFAGIDEVCVLPEHRGKGIAGSMIKHAVTKAHARTPVIKLHVLVENPAASLYHRLGFVAGPMFTDMKYAL